MHHEKRVRLKRMLPMRVKNPLQQLMSSNGTWSIDFVAMYFVYIAGMPDTE